MSEISDCDVGGLAIQEAQRTLDNQFDILNRTSSAAVELVKLNFIVTSIILAAVGIGDGFIPNDLVIGVIPLMASAGIAIFAYLDSVFRNPHYGMTFDLDILYSIESPSIVEFQREISNSYGDMLDGNKSMINRERWMIFISMVLFYFSLAFIAMGFLSGLV